MNKEFYFDRIGPGDLIFGTWNTTGAPIPSSPVKGRRGFDTPIYEPVQVGIKKGDVTLTMPFEVARTLAMVCWRVGGDPKSRRGDFDSLRQALQDALGKDYPSCAEADRAFGESKSLGTLNSAYPFRSSIVFVP